MKLRSVVIGLALLLASCRQGEAISYDGKVFEVHGWRGGKPAGGWSGAFAVYASQDEGDPPMAGAYAQRFGTIRFTPAFAPTQGLRVRAVFHSPSGEIVSRTFDAPKGAPAGPPVSLSAVYPTTAQWPANTLKIYLQFSGPMKRGVAYDHVRLLDEAGRAVDKPFVQIDQELWSPDMTRLTINFDPGRLKRGLKDNIAAGLPLIPGRHYTLVVDKDFPDAAGRPLTGELRKAIAAIPAVRLPVDPAKWRVIPPVSSASPLVVEFPRPMDHALALRVITVEGVTGTARLENDDQRWIFTPHSPWAKADYKLRVDKVIEDIAGNRLHQLFDMDVNDPAQMKQPPAFDQLGFSVK